MNFVYTVYNQLLATLQQAEYKSILMRDVPSHRLSPPLLILRRDVEWNPAKALSLAEIEQNHGIRSTYYFRTDTRACDLAAMRQLQDTGFEVGYHFNTLDRCHGDYPAAAALFEQDLARLHDAGIDVKTVKHHGNPRIRKVGYTSNRDLLARYPDLLERNSIMDADQCTQSSYPDLYYLSDVGIHWNPLSTTADILDGIRRIKWPVLYMANHPDYWSRSSVRAFGLQAAALGLRVTRLNRIIATVRRVVSPRR